jgi:hypothetical protein
MQPTYPTDYVGIICLFGRVGCVLYLPDNGDISPKHVGQFMCMDGLWVYTNCKGFLVYVVDYSRNERHK